MSKDQIREKFIQARQTLSWTWIQQKSRKIMETLFGLKDFQQARAVMFYVDMRKEVLTREAIEKALKQGKRVIVPKVKKGYGLLAIEIEDLNELKPGTFGVMEPESNEQVPLQDIDLVVVPGVAFTQHGDRIGYGAGYYDGFLPKLREGVKKIGVAYGVQLAESLPIEPHDIKMDLVITEMT